ncbi:MAG: TIGR03619 family F420-dependent LLM class oxidoreductase [Acidimicrobiia bacterium]
MTPTFGIKLAGLVPRWAPTIADLPALTVEFEQLGADEVVSGEHILYGPDMRHPGGSGKIRHSRSEQRSDFGDLFVLFSAMAARTTTLRFCSAVVLGPAHTFALLAKQSATLDVLSGGRFTLGVGTGWFRAEFEAVGVPYGERRARLDEIVGACRELWLPGLSSFDGKWISFTDLVCEPAPHTTGGPPVWWGISATTEAGAERIAAAGDGWIASEATPADEVARSVEAIHRACLGAGRDPATVGTRATLALLPASAPRSEDDVFAHALASAEQLRDVGVTHFTVPLDSYELDLEGTGRLLQALRHQGGNER